MWAQALPTASRYLSVVSVLKLEIGMPLVERRDRKRGAILRAWIDGHVLPSFSRRILVVDTAVAQRCASLHVPKPRSDRDALIAATALVYGMTVVTRNVSDSRPSPKFKKRRSRLQATGTDIPAEHPTTSESHDDQNEIEAVDSASLPESSGSGNGKSAESAEQIEKTTSEDVSASATARQKPVTPIVELLRNVKDGRINAYRCEVINREIGLTATPQNRDLPIALYQVAEKLGFDNVLGKRLVVTVSNPVCDRSTSVEHS